MDVFAEVKRIEDEAARLAAEAKAAGASALAQAREEAGAHRAQAGRALADESARMNASHEKKAAEGLAQIEADFRARRLRVEEASKNVDALAGWVAERYLSENP
jgi:hypothetical protein